MKHSFVASDVETLLSSAKFLESQADAFMSSESTRLREMAVEVGRLTAPRKGRAAGGVARWANKTPEERREGMRKAMAARWPKNRKKKVLLGKSS